MKIRPDLPRERARWRTIDDGVELLDAAFERHVYERHIHDAHAIGATLRGVQRFWCRGATRDSVPGDVISINPGEAHDGRSGSAGGYAYRMLYVPSGVLREIAADALEGPAPGLDAASPVRSDARLAARLVAAFDANADRPRTLRGDETLYEALLEFARTHAGLRASPVAAGPSGALHRVRDYLHSRLDQGVSVQELAVVAGMSRFRLTRQFQRAFGLPLHAYHLHVRLEEARRRLRLGASIARVAADLGFADQSHLHRRFKGVFGTSPGAWRSATRAEGWGRP
jgi:AraC-like DNA-binding protein